MALLARFHLAVLVAVSAGAFTPAVRATSVDSCAAAEPPISISGGTAAQREVVCKAVVLVDKLWKRENLWALVSKRNWLPSPKQAFIEGDAVKAALLPVNPGMQKYIIGRLGAARFHMKSRTNASTEPCGAVTLNKGNITSVSAMVNTIAHENSHTLGNGPGVLGCGGKKPFNSRFADGDYSVETTPWLVSYAFGDLAQCFNDSSGDEAATLACLQKKIDLNDSHDRLREECCAAKGHDQRASSEVEAIRKLRGHCAGVCAGAH